MSIQLEPIVVPNERPAALRVTGLTPDARYTVRVRSLRQHGPGTEAERTAGAGGELILADVGLPCGAGIARGEYAVDLLQDGSSVRLSFYAAPPDLHARRPLRCDFHIHTHYSDGNSSPAQMMVRGRELGLDVAAITDHNRYPPSLEAMDAVRRLGLGLIAGPGEEVSGPNWHIVAIAANAGIYDLGLQAGRFAGDAAWEIDALRWAVRETQARGGRAYLAHPYWIVERGYHLPSSWYDRVLEEGLLDGIELLGDVRHEDNARSAARYLDYRATGCDIPIVGNSDTHGIEHTYGSYWTLAFAREPALAGVLEAIADGWSVACTTAGRNGASRAERMWALGAFELVDYAYFLEQQFFPEHDRLCAEEAALAGRAMRGETPAAGAQETVRAALEAHYTRCWGTNTG